MEKKIIKIKIAKISIFRAPFWRFQIISQKYITSVPNFLSIFWTSKMFYIGGTIFCDLFNFYFLRFSLPRQIQLALIFDSSHLSTGEITGVRNGIIP